MANTVSDILQFAREVAHTDSNGLTDALGIDYANDALLEIQLEAARLREDLFLQESVRDITANEIVGGVTPGKFLFPTDMLFWKTMEINLVDPTKQNQFLMLTPFDVANTPANTSFDWLRINQPSAAPKIASHGDWFEIFPTPLQTLTSAIKLMYFLTPTLYTTTASSVVYPFSIDFRVLGYKTGAVYARAAKDFDLATSLDLKATSRLSAILSILAGSQSQQPRETEGLPLTGYEV